MAKYIVYGPPTKPEFEIPPNVSLGEFILGCLRKSGNKVAQIDGVTGKSVSFNELEQLSLELAQSFIRKGLRACDVVAICSENRLEYITVILASLYVGVTLAPINPLYTKDEILHNFRICQPKFVITSPYCLEKITDATAVFKGIKEIIIFGDFSFRSSVPLTNYYKLFGKGTKPIKFQIPQISEAAPGVILSSSGTTGLPKGVVLSQRNLRCFLNTMKDPDLKLFWNTTVLCIVPSFHGFGYGTLLANCVLNSTVVLLPKFEENLFLSAIQKYKIAVLPLVPTLITFLAKHPLVQKYNLRSVTDILSGAAPCGEKLMKEASQKLGINGIHQGYGMTETSILASYCHCKSNKPSSVGKLVPGLDCKIIDLKTGMSLGRGEVGEVCFKGPGVMQGYAGNKKATSEAIDSEGWLKTGDIGYFDDEDYLYIVDRLKELIKYKGYQVAPAELEDVLLSCPGVADAGVIGIPDKVDGELPLAFVVKGPGSKVTEKDIVNFIADKLSPQKWLRGGVRFVDAIPKNPSGKILRRVLREMVRTKANL